MHYQLNALSLHPSNAAHVSMYLCAE